MSKKVFRGFITVVIVIILAAAAWFAGWKITGQMNPVKWGKNSADTTQTEQDKTEVIAISEDGKKFLTANSYAMPRAMSFVTKQSTYSKSKEFNVTATLSNQYISGKFDWSVSFVNPASAWATGKVAEYYVQANPTSDGSATATIKYISSFSEPIQVTATLRGSDSSDTCQIDCLKDLEMYNNYLDTGDFGETIQGGCELSGTTGTIFADYQILYAGYELDSSFTDTVQSYLKFNIEIHNFGFQMFADENSLVIEEQNENRLQFYFVLDHILTYSDFIENFDAFDDEHKEAVYYAWYHAALDLHGGGIKFEIGLSAYVNGVNTSITTGYDNPMEITGEKYGKDVKPSVTLNQNVIF